MTATIMVEKCREAWHQGRRLVAPLMGFPGVNLTNSSIKLAQQNYGEHYRAIKTLYNRFRPDVIFPLMDLSVEANAVGRYTLFPEHDSATVVKAAFDQERLDRLREVNVACDTRMIGYVETMKLMSLGLPDDVLKGAYVTGPYSLAALLIGADEAAMATILDPQRLHELCDFAVQKVQEYAMQFLAAGAQVVCVLEPTAVMLGIEQFREFSANYVRRIAECCRHSGAATVYHVCGNTMHLIEPMAAAGVNGLSLDSPDVGIDLAETARRLPEDIVVIGNVNPSAVLAHSTPGQVIHHVGQLLDAMEPYPNFILSTGCDLPQETPFENIEAFMQIGRAYRRSRRPLAASA